MRKYKYFILAAVFVLTGCKNYTRENADKLVQSYIDSQNGVAETEDTGSMVYDNDFQEYSPLCTYVDCDWDMYNEMNTGNLYKRLYSLLKQARTTYETGYLPYGMYIANTTEGQEWYYSYNEENTLKFAMGDIYTVAMYYYNPAVLSKDSLTTYIQKSTKMLCDEYDCSIDELEISMNEQGDVIVAMPELCVGYGISGDEVAYYVISMVP